MSAASSSSRRLADPAVGGDVAPSGGSRDAELDAGEPCRLDRGGEVLPRLERADGEHVVALRGRPVRREDRVDAVRDDPDPLDRDVRAASTSSSRVNAETATIASAARTPAAQRKGPGHAVPARERAPGAAARRASWTVTTSGARGETGARNVVQWRTSTRAEARPSRKGYQSASRRTLASRPVPPAARPTSSRPGPALERAEQAEHVARSPCARLDERRRVDRDPHDAALRSASRGSG